MLWRTNGLVLFVVVTVALFAAAEIGYFLGRRRHEQPAASSAYVSSLQGALLGLLALLLAFTIAMAVSRFDARKALVVEEANAIGTTYLRARLLPDAAMGESRQLLREYLPHRLELYNAGIDEARLEAVNKATARIQARLWDIAAAESRRDPASVATALYIDTLNGTIDLAEKRLAALKNQLPETILYVVFAVALGGLGLLGYGTSLTGRHRGVSSGVFVVLVAMVLMVILDMDRPRRGLIRVDQGSLLRLQESMAEPAVIPAP